MVGACRGQGWSRRPRCWTWACATVVAAAAATTTATSGTGAIVAAAIGGRAGGSGTGEAECPPAGVCARTACFSYASSGRHVQSVDPSEPCLATEDELQQMLKDDKRASLRLHPDKGGVPDSSQRPMLPSKVPFKHGRHAMTTDVSVDMYVSTNPQCHA